MLGKKCKISKKSFENHALLWLMDWFTYRFIDWFIDWSIDWSTDQFIVYGSIRH